MGNIKANRGKERFSFEAPERRRLIEKYRNIERAYYGEEGDEDEEEEKEDPELLAFANQPGGDAELEKRRSRTNYRKTIVGAVSASPLKVNGLTNS